MKAVIRLKKGIELVDTPARVTTTGQPILPAVGDLVRFQGGVYKVKNVCWFYDHYPLEVVAFATYQYRDGQGEGQEW